MVSIVSYSFSWIVRVHLVGLHRTEGVVDNPMVSFVRSDGQDDITHHCTFLIMGMGGRGRGDGGEGEGGHGTHISVVYDTVHNLFTSHQQYHNKNANS